jgi:hypothetical protein
MRAKWPEPPSGSSIDLVETATAAGFSADRTFAGVAVRSGRFFGADGRISSDTLSRFAGLLRRFPHGPVGCQVAVPNDRSSVWGARVARLAQRLARFEDGRVSTRMVATKSLQAGTVQCTFAAYREP